MGKKYPLHDFSQIPTFTEIAMLKAELESIRAKLPKWHRCDEPDDDGFVAFPPESGCYFAKYDTTWADGVTKRYCEPIEFDADADNGETAYTEIHNCPMCGRKFGKD